MTTAILGLQWGDEGKGKITHLLAQDADMVVRFNGGPNAGHTVIDRGVKFGTHLIPAGAFYAGCQSVLAAGMVIDLAVLRDEIDLVAQHTGSAPDVLIDDNAHLILPYHRLQEELEGSGAHFGTTRRGISPAYRDKVSHVGVRAGDLLRPDVLIRRISWRLDLLKRQWPSSHELQAMTAEGLAGELLDHAAPMLEAIRNVTPDIRQALETGKNVLFEGAQGTLLDVDHGTYPYVTSSSTTFAGLGNSIGIPSPSVEHRIGIAKAYTTRVGEGPFPTELHDESGNRLRDQGGEYGVTTGRPRRCGWLDLVALKHAVDVNGTTELALTKLDVLSGMDTVRVCRAYRVDGEETQRFPLDSDVLERCNPVYTDFPGWSAVLTGATAVDELPPEARQYVKMIEEALGTSVSILSIGPARDDTIIRSL